MRVAVCFNLVPPNLYKGESGDRISEEGAEVEAKAVCDALRGIGHSAVLIPLGADLEPFIAGLRSAVPDLVFNLCEGFWGDSRKEMHVAALLDLLGHTYTGASSFCLGLTQDKVRAKDLLTHHHLPTPRYILIEPGQTCPKSPDLAWPLFVKPRFEDASLGITTESIVESGHDLQKRVHYIHETYRQGALVEEFIDGREFNAAVIGNAPCETLPLSEIQFRPGLSRRIVSYEGKWVEDSPEYARTEPVCPASLDLREELLLRDAALRAYNLLGCRDYARVDIRLRDGVPYILEVNANPDISPGAGLARATRAAGMTYPEFIERILAMAVRRKELCDAKP